MKIIPVMDLLNEKVVHGIGGERKEYLPISNSIITKSAEPLIVANDFYEKLGLNCFYIADLNLIQKTERKEMNKNKVFEIKKKTNFHLMMDGGCTTSEDVIKILDLGIDQAIIGTETLDSLAELEKIVDLIDKNKIILSIDFKGGKIITKNQDINRLSISELIEIIDSYSLEAIIVLELQKVGSQSGPLNNSLLEIMKQEPKTKIFVGGGVRNIQDLFLLQQYGVSGVLIATAFHKGLITKEDLILLD